MSPPQEQSLSNHAQEVLRDLKNGIISKSEARNGLQVYIEMARGIPLLISPFVDIGSVLLAGMGYSEEEEQNEQFNSDKEELLFLYDKIVDLQPYIEDVLEGLSDDPSQLRHFIKKLENASNSAKTDDTSSLKPAIIRYLPKDPDNEVKPRFPPTGTKAVRGFRNLTTARHLCPIKKLAEFDANPQTFINNVSEGRLGYIFKTGDWPSFLFDLDELDKNNPMQGFLRGHVLVRVYRHIYTGPSSSLHGNRCATKPAKSHIHKHKNVTGRGIAYAAVQARFAISSSEKWCIKDGKFNLAHFFNNIVALFENDPKNPWVLETLAWWDKQVPDLKKTIKTKRGRRILDLNDSSEDEGADEMLHCLQAQRAVPARADTLTRQYSEEVDEQRPLSDQPSGQDESDSSLPYHHRDRNIERSPSPYQPLSMSSAPPPRARFLETASNRSTYHCEPQLLPPPQPSHVHQNRSSHGCESQLSPPPQSHRRDPSRPPTSQSSGSAPNPSRKTNVTKFQNVHDESENLPQNNHSLKIKLKRVRREDDRDARPKPKKKK
ncbi:hypothetical protein C0992_005914 [Termitomyces sp. T32_za158]|nr:hypothetical protein C0992_005914 [Termitomyces sp. T32_za158]